MQHKRIMRQLMHCKQHDHIQSKRATQARSSQFTTRAAAAAAAAATTTGVTMQAPGPAVSQSLAQRNGRQQLLSSSSPQFHCISGQAILAGRAASDGWLELQTIGARR